MSKKIKVTVWGLALLFGIMLSLAFTIEGLGFVAILAFTPLFCIERLCREHHLKGSWWYGFAAFMFYNIGASWWIWNVSNVGAIATIILNSLQMGAIYAIFRWSIKVISRQGWKHCDALPYIFFTLMWIGWEHIYFNIELSWPWLVLGNAFATSPQLVQWYEATGVLGGSLWILAGSILAYFTITGKKTAIATLCVILIPIISSLVRYHSYQESDNPKEVVIVQPNIDPFEKYGVIPQSDIDEALFTLSEQSLTPDTHYVVTPETFTYNLDLDSPEGNDSYNRYLAFIGKHPKVTLLVGALTHRFYSGMGKPSESARRSAGGWYDVFNSAITMDTTGIIDFYHKSKLVPGVEIIPYQRYLPFLGKIVASCGGSSSSYGVMKQMKALGDGHGGKVASMICYESVYGDFSREATLQGAGFMAVMTNDGWWGDTPGYHQHFRFAALRAIENRRDVVQAANTGTSGFINQRGDVISSTPWWVATSLRGEVNLNDAVTPFVRYGDITGRLCCWGFLASLTALLMLSLKRRRRR